MCGFGGLRSKEVGEFAKTGASTKVDPDKGTGKSSTVRLGKIYKRLNQNYCAKEMSHIQIAERVGPGFEI